ncbi:hypothetical protein Z947_3809 [Sulfitobacter geojensis]|nr:hypothetical protein Z947_3809 [Sulfitobacter geojensis]
MVLVALARGCLSGFAQRTTPFTAPYAILPGPIEGEQP